MPAIDDPLVSVVIPTYNRADLLVRSLESALSQTYQHIEILIINDGSTDNTDQVMEPYLKKYPNQIRYIVQKNTGVAGAKNRGIHEATGDYIAFLDSDDYWLPQKLEKQVNYLKAHPQVALTFAKMKILKNGIMIEKQLPSIPALSFEDLFLGDGMIPFATVMIRKEVFDSLGVFDETLSGIEDFAFWVHLLRKYKVHFMDETLAVYNIHGENVTSNPKPLRQKGIKFYSWLFKGSDIPRHLIKRKLSYEYYQLFRLCYADKEYKDAFKYMAGAVCASPLVGVNFYQPGDPFFKKWIKLLKPYGVLAAVSVLSFFDRTTAKPAEKL